MIFCIVPRSKRIFVLGTMQKNIKLRCGTVTIDLELFFVFAIAYFTIPFWIRKLWNVLWCKISNRFMNSKSRRFKIFFKTHNILKKFLPIVQKRIWWMLIKFWKELQVRTCLSQWNSFTIIIYQLFFFITR